MNDVEFHHVDWSNIPAHSSLDASIPEDIFHGCELDTDLMMSSVVAQGQSIIHPLGNSQCITTGSQYTDILRASSSFDLLCSFCGKDALVSQEKVHLESYNSTNPWDLDPDAMIQSSCLPGSSQYHDTLIKDDSKTSNRSHIGACIPTKFTQLEGTPPNPKIRSSGSNICAVDATNDPKRFIFRCCYPACRGKEFGRWYDFDRHFNGAHATIKTAFWCPVPECNRSEREGNRPFPRKDRMFDHASKVHGIGKDDPTFELARTPRTHCCVAASIITFSTKKRQR